MEVNKEHKITFKFYFDGKDVDENEFLDNFFYVSTPLEKNLEQLGIAESKIDSEELVLTLFDNCEHVENDEGEWDFKYPIFGKWVLDHYNESRKYFDGDSTGLEQAFKDWGVCLSMQIKDDKNEEVYSNDNVIKSLDESKLWFKDSSELISYYIDGFIDF
tara:strand:- start:927 stop:1406 length:480 start_codon:yes stop_codon:yes gene_type:complete